MRTLALFTAAAIATAILAGDASAFGKRKRKKAACPPPPPPCCSTYQPVAPAPVPAYAPVPVGYPAPAPVGGCCGY